MLRILPASAYMRMTDSIIVERLKSITMTSPITPQLFTTLKQGYSLSKFQADSLSGLTVAIVALPLGMALGIASGATPEQGLITTIIAGFLISFLGGSKFQIGGPTGAFVVVIYNVIEKFGYNGLIMATLMAGVILMITGFLRLGTYIKHIPASVVTGFTAGIGITIFSTQIKDLLGLQIEKVPGEFLEKWHLYIEALPTAGFSSVAIAAFALVTIIMLRIKAPKLPAFLFAVVGGSILALILAMDVPTIGSAFGGIPREIPTPSVPHFDAKLMLILLPSAITIAFLAGIESLLSAVVADRMTKEKHRSNTELVAQGFANCASAIFGGMPATGAIARTATNIRAGAVSPMSGILHAIFVLLFILIFAPLASYIPLAALAGVLVIVAWNMSDAPHVVATLKDSWGPALVMVATLLLTVLADLTIAITVGVILAIILKKLKWGQPEGGEASLESH
jgi:SulP family sulfate permease